ncbi:MAG: hypothetical protein AAFS10_25315, partial [Myxococcota bacterium]
TTGVEVPSDEERSESPGDKVPEGGEPMPPDGAGPGAPAEEGEPPAAGDGQGAQKPIDTTHTHDVADASTEVESNPPP